MSVEERLAQLGIMLPDPPRPVGSYVPVVKTGNLLFLSGMIPFQNGKVAWTGKLGRELTVEQGQQAARLALCNALAVIGQALGGLEQVSKIVRLSGYVASAPDFNQQPSVLNGASDLLVEIFGEKGRHARLALGVNELPLNASVELELIVEVVKGAL